MADKHIADGESGFKAVSSGPDACRVGNQVVPFDSIQTLNRQKRYDTNTKARGEPILTVGSIIAGTQSNAGSGVVSGTSLGGGDVIVLTGSPTVKANGQPVARHLSDVAMNNANTTGKLYTQAAEPNAPVEDNRVPCNDPPKTSEQLERLEADLVDIKANRFNAHRFDKYVDFEGTSKYLGGLINEIRPDADGGFLSGAAGATRGTLGFLKDGVLGLGQLGYALSKRLSPLTQMQDQVEMAILAENIRLGNVCLELVKQQAKAMGKELAKPVTDAWERGDYTEAITRGGLELATIVIPLAKAGLAAKAARAGKVAETTAVADRMSDAAKTANAERAAAEAAKKPPAKPVNPPPANTAPPKPTPPKSTDGVHVKATYGERIAHDKVIAQGHEPVGNTTGQYAKGGNGIDGVYKNKTPPPDYIITEAKYGTSTQGSTIDGKQMSDGWIRGSNRLDDKVGKAEAHKIRQALNNGSVERWLINVKQNGSATKVLLDSAGNKIGKPVPF